MRLAALLLNSFSNAGREIAMDGRSGEYSVSGLSFALVKTIEHSCSAIG
jgi:hypothetical protein